MSFFGLGDLKEKVTRIIERVRKPIIRGIDWVLNKFKPLVMAGQRLWEKGEQKLVQAGTSAREKLTGGGKEDGKTTNVAGDDDRSFTFLGESHTLRLHHGGTDKPSLSMASASFKSLRDRLILFRRKYADAPKGYLVSAKHAKEAGDLGTEISELIQDIKKLEALPAAQLANPQFVDQEIREVENRLEEFSNTVLHAFGPGGALKVGDIIIDKGAADLGKVVELVGNLEIEKAEFGFYVTGGRFLSFESYGQTWSIPPPGRPVWQGFSHSGDVWKSVGLQQLPADKGGGPANPSCTWPWWRQPVPGWSPRIWDQRGHLVAESLGGPGSCDNLVAMHTGSNQGLMPTAKSKARNAINADPTLVLDYLVKPIWNPGNSPSSGPPNTITITINKTYPATKIFFGPYQLLNW